MRRKTKSDDAAFGKSVRARGRTLEWKGCLQHVLLVPSREASSSPPRSVCGFVDIISFGWNQWLNFIFQIADTTTSESGQHCTNPKLQASFPNKYQNLNRNTWFTSTLCWQWLWNKNDFLSARMRVRWRLRKCRTYYSMAVQNQKSTRPPN